MAVDVLDPTPEDWKRLWNAIEARAEELEMDWTEVAGAVKLSDTSLYKIRDGVGLSRPKKIDGIDAGMRWVKGSTRGVLAGGQPTPLDPPDYLTRQRGEELFARREVVEELFELVEAMPGTIDAHAALLREMRSTLDELAAAVEGLTRRP